MIQLMQQIKYNTVIINLQYNNKSRRDAITTTNDKYNNNKLTNIQSFK